MRSFGLGLVAALFVVACQSAPEPKAPESQGAAEANAAPSAQTEDVASPGEPGVASAPPEEPPPSAPPVQPEQESQGSGYGTSADDPGPGRLADEAPRPTPPKVRVGKLIVAGGEEDSQKLMRVIRERTGDYRACYEKGLEKKPELEGRIVYRVDIQAEGTFSNVRKQEADMPDEAVVSCVQKALGKVRVEQRERKGVTVDVPLVFAL